jgi:RHS repeat-associated protein
VLELHIVKPPYGMLIKDRSYTSDTYRFGFNGKEKDDDVNGDGNCYDYGFRIYNSRLGKFLSVDPLFKSYPWYTPYQFSGNKPVRFIDLDGLEEDDPMDDPYFMTRLILTTFYDIKHSVYNLVLPKYPMGAPIKLVADYKLDSKGNQIFETEFKWVPTGTIIQEIGQTTLDMVNVVGAGKLDPTDFISIKSKSVLTQTTKALKTAIISRSTAVIKNTSLPGTSSSRSIGNGKGYEYQSYLSGKPIKDGKIEEFNYNGVDFDGYSNGILFDAKDGYKTWFNNDGSAKDWVKNTSVGDDLADQANRQIKAADGNYLQWIFSDKEAAANMRDLLKSKNVDVDKIEFKYVEKPIN